MSFVRNKRCSELTDAKTNYYVPLAQPSATGELDESWDPTKLPLRTHESFEQALSAIKAATSKKHAAELSMYHGISKCAALHRVSSVDLA